MADDDSYGDLADEDILAALDGPEHSGAGKPQYMPERSSLTLVNDAVGLDELPSDAFSSSPEPLVPQSSTSRRVETCRMPAPSRQDHERPGTRPNFRQTTLLGGVVSDDGPDPRPPARGRPFVADRLAEEPVSHELDSEALKTWVYPENLGAIRDYQYTIVKQSLFTNTLVALPTGLGKTFIAATVMLNFYRWTKSAKIVFVAPTKPLASQQVDACFNIVGIPRSDTSLLTGDVPPALRAEEWQEKRVFFMTPQTLTNDLSHGYAKPRSIALLVVDEAHRAVGEYAYTKAISHMRRVTNGFRVLGLTATPGSNFKSVQEVISNLGIAHVEIRTEDSMDIRPYVHQRSTELVTVDYSDEILRVRELFSKTLQPLVDKLSQQNVYAAMDPMSLSNYGLMKARREWFASRSKNANQAIQGMMRAIFGALTSVAHSIKLLNFHGIKPFFNNMKELRSEVEAKRGPKYQLQIVKSDSFTEMMDDIDKWYKTDDYFVGHPKLAVMAETLLGHFMDHQSNPETRVIVFSEFRDSAEEIVRVLDKHRPMVRSTVFVGQADSKRSEGMKQAQQLETIEKFKRGVFNVLVATSIGEEGLDIGQVDLIVCYDASSSPIRMLQRMGRTGRKRAGRIVLLLMRGKEEEQYANAKRTYEDMQKVICEGSRFELCYNLSLRIVPSGCQPQVDKRRIEIPIENTQNRSLPEPRRRDPRKKKPPKVFHMPDGVDTGFVMASALGKPKASTARRREQREADALVDIPSLEGVLLKDHEEKELDRLYRHVVHYRGGVEEAHMPELSEHPSLQRSFRPIGRVPHGQHTKRCVSLFRTLGRVQDLGDKWTVPWTAADGETYHGLPLKDFASDTDAEPESKPDRKRQRREREEMDEGDRQPKRRKPGPKPRKAEVARTNDFMLADESQVTVVDIAPRPRGRPRRGGLSRGQGRQRPRAGRGINSDEVGDDCDRDSDMLDTDGSDDGADLADFIVSDTRQPLSEASRLQSTPPTPASCRPSRGKERSHKRSWSPADISGVGGSQESADLPDLAAVAGLSSPQAAKVPARRPRRSMILDFDSDE